MSYVAFLRGINLGKLNKVDMKSLRSLFEGMGFQDVQTYIQTGNVLFTNVASDEQHIEDRLKEAYGFDIPVTIRSKDELTTIQQHPLFSRENVHIMFLKEQISNEQIEFLQSIVDDEFSVIDQKTIIINLTKNYHQTKYTNAFFEKKLQISSTLRNRNTVEKILLKM
ncbi:DUF1697 domain-containing protein [Sporosarcina sp. ACRSL]|uniref:DUF1697 domain-containing protein n=1 Tax=Sporosarcina sp. ACRSL TaxID=2918215 RepID=UPI001EF6AE90|nr:DUF1697 domain-containing protein [Sporosarcina sp. ACRSL]MCG7345837.1 DUF1697 domain-containing protein [Sporosarcina sp. ACRSL]